VLNTYPDFAREVSADVISRLLGDENIDPEEGSLLEDESEVLDFYLVIAPTGEAHSLHHSQWYVVQCTSAIYN
jgi:hypothetical protein